MTAYLAERGGGSATAVIEIPPDEVDAFMLFKSLQTQWNWHPMVGMRTGINYAAIAATAAMLSVEVTPALFLDIRTMENAALEAWARAPRGRA